MSDTDTNLRESLSVTAEEPDAALQGLYTPAMLASAIGVPLPAIRRWERRGYLRVTAERNRLSYFDFGEATVARRLSELLEASGSLAGVDRLVDALNGAYPEAERPLVTAPLVLESGELYLRDGDALAEPGGQRILDFASGFADPDDETSAIFTIATEDNSGDQRSLAIDLHDEGATDEAIETLRLAMLNTGSSPDDHFILGEWLYEAGQLDAARERFYAALELDEDHVEARVNLACLLAETGQTELAIAAFRGTLEEHPFYADAHYHLGATLQRFGERETAEEHFRRFLEIAPESPWAEEARRRLEASPST